MIDLSEIHDLTTPEPITAGVILRRTPDGLETNIPHRVIEHSPTGYEWGYEGSGPADLALNVLEAALIAMGHNGHRSEAYRGDCYHMAWDFHQDFKRAFIGQVPREGGVIPWQELRAWITEQAQAAGVCLACGRQMNPLQKRYCNAVCEHDAHMRGLENRINAMGFTPAELAFIWADPVDNWPSLAERLAWLLTATRAEITDWMRAGGLYDQAE